MNGDTDLMRELATLAGNQTSQAPQIVICPPHTLLTQATITVQNSALEIGGQDCHALAKGAYTGDVAATMVAETGATHVIVGHSERRDGHGETSETVRAKAQAAWVAGLTAIICIGESEAERACTQTLAIIGAQLQASLPDGATAANTVSRGTFTNAFSLTSPKMVYFTGRWGLQLKKQRLLTGAREKALMKTASEMGRFPATIKRLKEDSGRIIYLTTEQIEQLIKAAISDALVMTVTYR